MTAASEGRATHLPYPDHPSLRDRAVIVTGAGRGFGRFIAEALLHRGARVVATAARTPDEVEALARWAEKTVGAGRCLPVVADVADWEACRRTVDAALDAFGRIDVLINNAGRAGSEYHATAGPDRVPFYEIPPEAFRTIIEGNLIGAFNMARACVPQMVKQGKGKVVSLSTSLSTMAAPGLSPYGASKAGLELTHRVWAREMEGTGVDLNILLPGGPADTGFITQSMAPGEIGSRDGLLPGDVVVPPAVWLCAEPTDGISGERIIARFWDPALPPAEALAGCIQPRNELPGIM